MNFFIFCLWCLIGGLLNRLGGCALNLPLKSKWRDWGVSLVGVWVLYQIIPKSGVVGLWVALVAFFLASWGSLSSYFDHWWTSGVDFWEWVICGFAIGMSGIPIAMYTGSWFGFAIRTVALMAFMPYSNKLQLKIFSDGTDGVEGSRGIAYIATLPLLVI